MADLMRLLREYSPSGIARVGGGPDAAVIQVVLTLERSTITDALVTAINAVRGATGEEVVGVDADMA